MSNESGGKKSIESSDTDSSNRLRSNAVLATTEYRKGLAYKDFHPYGRCVIPISPYGWYRVLVYSHNSGLSTEEVLEKLRLAVKPRNLNYYYFHEGGEPDEGQDKRATFTFYVDSHRMAKTLQLKGHSPPQIGVRVNDNPPNIQVNDFYKLKVQEVIMSRYDSGRCCLNLSRFYADDCLKGEFCALQQFECLELVIDIMEMKMPQLRRLMLDNNHLSILAGFRGVERRFPRLKSISLQNNRLATVHELRIFEQLPITELNLRSNPLPSTYEQLLAIMFPHLRVLNERSLGRMRSSVLKDGEVDSDVEFVSVSKRKLAESRYLYLVPHSPEIQPGIRKFVRHYLKAFDGDNRLSNLERFYHDNSLVTLIADKKNNLWSTHCDRQLLSSRQAALQMFAAWPKTRHVPSTMTLDLMLVQIKMLFVSITGNFLEFGKSEKLRYYSRSFILTRSEKTDDFRIANELVYLGRGQKSLNPIQQTLMAKLSAETQLKSRWCCKLLKDTNWDYKQSLLAFRTLLHRCQIPEKAFKEGDTESETTP